MKTERVKNSLEIKSSLSSKKFSETNDKKVLNVMESLYKRVFFKGGTYVCFR